MAKGNSLPDAHERLSDAEIVALKGRLAPADGAAWDLRAYGATHVDDIAEAMGMPASVVLEHLSRIRAEQAFSTPARTARNLPLLPAVSVVVALAAILITWFRVRDEGPYHAETQKLLTARAQPPAAPTTTQVYSRAKEAQQLPMPVHVIQTGDSHPPPGFRIEVAGAGMDLLGDGLSDKFEPLPYQTEFDRLSNTTQDMIDTVDAIDAPPVAKEGVFYRDMLGSSFKIGRKQAHYTINGWAGADSGTVTLPLGEKDRKRIAEGVAKLLAPYKKQQQDSLDISVDPLQGMVLPPPGFRVQFAGRRMDMQEGPHIYFLPIDSATALKRLVLAIRNAAERDRRPPTGPWTQDAAAEAKIPVPASSHVVVTGPEGVATFDLPTKNGWSQAAEEMIRIETKPLTEHIHG